MNPSIFQNPHFQADIRFDFGTSASAVRAFHETLPEYARTPLHTLPGIAKAIGVGHVLLKDESTRLGLSAFKVLGASWATVQALATAIEALDPRISGWDRSQGVSLEQLRPLAQSARFVLYAATDGNHGQAVARMAKYLGIHAQVFVPHTLDDEAISKIAKESATVVVVDGDYDQSVLAAKSASDNHPESKGLLISDTALVFGEQTANWIVEGYQTMFGELEEQILEHIYQREITAVITPVGAGSLAQAVVKHFRAKSTGNSKPEIVTVEPETAACLRASLEAGKLVSVKTGYTICSGMCCGTLSLNAWPVLRDGVVIATTVSESAVDEAVQQLEREGIHAGPCGAASLASLQTIMSSGALGLGPESVVVILCTEGTRTYHLRELKDR